MADEEVTETTDTTDTDVTTDTTVSVDTDVAPEVKVADTDITATDDDGGSDDKPKDSNADKGEFGAPDKYEAFTTPDDVTLSDEVLAGYAEFARSIELNQKQAQALMDLQIKSAQNSTQAGDDAKAEQAKTWAEELRADPKHGGVKLEATVANARKAIEALGGEALRSALKTAGISNNPSIVKAFSLVGVEMSEDHLSFGASNSEISVDDLTRSMFPNSDHK
jgi:hypothetical protein